MNAFEKVIGYETVKNELMQICDMVHNKERYEALGAKIPQGVLFTASRDLEKHFWQNALLRNVILTPIH